MIDGDDGTQPGKKIRQNHSWLIIDYLIIPDRKKHENDLKKAKICHA